MKKYNILHQNVPIKSTSVKTLIKDQKDLFSYIDSDFESYGASVHSYDTKEEELAVLEINEEMTFAQMFPNPEAMKLTQGQIVAFVEEHKDKLNQDGYSTFFLFNSGLSFFVAGVRVYSDGLYVDVHRFGYSDVWDAECHHRMVVPKLALKDLELDPLNLETLDTSEADKVDNAIKLLKNHGYRITKEIITIKEF